MKSGPLSFRANSANTEAANTHYQITCCADQKMRRRLTLAAAMLQSTHTLQPLVQRCCAESLAGCAGGLAKQLAVYPLDRAATRLETKKGAKATNVQQAYRGAGVLMLFALPYAIAFHVPFVIVENALPVGDAAARASIAGFLAALAAAPVGVPAEACKRRVQLGAPVKEALVGGRSLYDGFWATAARNVPYNAAAFGAYRFLERRRVSPLLCGVGAGVACAVATHPFDVVDARQQTARTSSSAAPPPSFFALETWASLARDPGALVRGLLPRVCALAPGTWLFFAVFRPVRDMLMSV